MPWVPSQWSQLEARSTHRKTLQNRKYFLTLHTLSIVPSYVLQHTLNAPALCVRRFISDFLPLKETVAHPHDNLSRKRQKLVSASSYYSSGNFENMKSYDKTPSFGLPMATLYHTAMQPTFPKQHRPNFQQVKAKRNKNTKNQGRLVKK